MKELIDTPQQMVSVRLTPHSATPPWPSASQSILRVRLGVTLFSMLTLPHVTLRITAKDVKKC